MRIGRSSEFGSSGEGDLRIDEITTHLESGRLDRRGFMRAALALGLTLPAASALLAACGGGESAGSAVSADPPATTPDKLVVRNWGDPWRSFWQDTAGRTFTEETGIPVQWDTTDTIPLMTRVRAAIGADQRPPVDAVMGESVQGYLAHVQELSTELNPDIVTVLPSLNQDMITPGFDIPDLSMVGLYSFSVPLNYRSDKVQAQDLQSWDGLWSDAIAPKSVGLTGQYQWFTFPVAKTIGVDPATDDMTPVWERLSELQPKVLGLLNDTQMTNFLISGEAHVALAISGDGIAARKEGAPIGWAVPEEGMVVDRDFYFVLRNIPDDVAYYANVFANHLYDAATQTEMAEMLGVVPANPSATLPDYMSEDPDVYPFTEEQVAANILLPIPLVAEHADEWQAAYDEALK